MGLMVDTNVLIRFERTSGTVDVSSWAPSEPVFISAVVVAELLMGVQRADTDARRDRRSAFVEAVISGVGVLDFTVAIARVHAVIHADLSKKGIMIGAHDLIIAATARHYDHSLLTENVDEFSRVPGLRVMPFVL